MNKMLILCLYLSSMAIKASSKNFQKDLASWYKETCFKISEYFNYKRLSKKLFKKYGKIILEKNLSIEGVLFVKYLNVSLNLKEWVFNIHLLIAMTM